MAIDQAGADNYFKTQLANNRWKDIKKQDKAIAMAITEIATALGFDDDADLDDTNENIQFACYEQALFLAENLSGLNAMQIAQIGNLDSQSVDGLGEERYRTGGKVKELNGIILAPRANMFLRRYRGPFRVIR